MNGDFSRDSFDRSHGFSRVLLQQGRVLLDADWNEQTSIILHYLRALARDLIGPHGGPAGSFEIGCDDSLKCDFTIGRGRYYVDGILCENEPPLRCTPSGMETSGRHGGYGSHFGGLGRHGAHDVPQEGAPPRSVPALTYTRQPYYLLAEGEELKHGVDYFVYLDVWERHLTYLEAPHIREVALGGPDTATRARVLWQVRLLDENECRRNGPLDCESLLAAVVRERRGCLRARARLVDSSDDPCIIPPEARYRGPENQLYRVEIHEGGETGGGKHGATFKWSRDNGSVIFGVRSLQGAMASLDSLGPDDRRSLVQGDWVEVVDDRSVLRGEPGILARVDAIDRVRSQVTLSVSEGTPLPDFDEKSTTHPLLRRWDQGSPALPVQEGKWIDLEDGVQVLFEPGGSYRTADYWLIPARTATGDVEWPTEAGEDGTGSPLALPPRGIEHHYAPLGRITVDEDGFVTCVEDCRCVFDQPCADIETAPLPSPPAGPTPSNADRASEATATSLASLRHVGERRAQRLRSAGHTTVAQVADMSAEEIQRVLGISRTVAEQIRNSARESLQR